MHAGKATERASGARRGDAKQPRAMVDPARQIARPRPRRGVFHRRQITSRAGALHVSVARKFQRTVSRPSIGVWTQNCSPKFRDTDFLHCEKSLQPAQKDAAGTNWQIGRDATSDRCHYPVTRKSRARRTKRGCRGEKKAVTVGGWFLSAPPGRWGSKGKKVCPSSVVFVPRLAGVSLPLFLPVAGGARRSRDDHRR